MSKQTLLQKLLDRKKPVEQKAAGPKPKAKAKTEKITPPQEEPIPENKPVEAAQKPAEKPVKQVKQPPDSKGDQKTQNPSAKQAPNQPPPANGKPNPPKDFEKSASGKAEKEVPLHVVQPATFTAPNEKFGTRGILRGTVLALGTLLLVSLFTGNSKSGYENRISAVEKGLDTLAQKNAVLRDSNEYLMDVRDSLMDDISVLTDIVWDLEDSIHYTHGLLSTNIDRVNVYSGVVSRQREEIRELEYALQQAQEVAITFRDSVLKLHALNKTWENPADVKQTFDIEPETFIANNVYMKIGVNDGRIVVMKAGSVNSDRGK